MKNKKARTVKQALDAIAWMLQHVGWCQGVAYRNQFGTSIDQEDINKDNLPTCMCIAGAWGLVEYANPSIKNKTLSSLNQAALEMANVYSVIRFNDGSNRTLADMLEMIEIAKKPASPQQ